MFGRFIAAAGWFIGSGGREILKNARFSRFFSRGDSKNGRKL
jgi:hypothetical protein